MKHCLDHIKPTLTRSEFKTDVSKERRRLIDVFVSYLAENTRYTPAQRMAVATLREDILALNK